MELVRQRLIPGSGSDSWLLVVIGLTQCSSGRKQRIRMMVSNRGVECTVVVAREEERTERVR